MYFFQNTSAIQWCRGEIVTTFSPAGEKVKSPSTLKLNQMKILIFYSPYLKYKSRGQLNFLLKRLFYKSYYLNNFS